MTLTTNAETIPESAVAPQKRVPIDVESYSTTHQVLVDMLVELRALTARASAGESRSSATITTSARGVDLSVKSYADGLLPDAIGDAVAGYARGQRELAALQARQWQDAVP